MAILSFPPVHKANEEGLLAVGGDLEVPSLLLAYSEGIFPWPISSHYPLAWFSPDPRGVLKFEDLHISRSLKKLIKQNKYDVTYNTQFEDVIQNCSQINNRKGQTGTWITNEIMMAYTDLFYAGQAYSVEVKNKNGELKGGLYGVHINKFVSGESMFFKDPNTSKIALVELMLHLNKNNISFLDTQMLTPVIENLGGKAVPRTTFMEMLKESRTSLTTVDLFPPPPKGS
ncbi:MAG: leucyl/phenylalanyl-tRNA--protein transferase [Bdellovibrionota bacterium]|nr:leucyl/phenylalanyl-tRNA--protein transferase [Bdellovibrionota bacterium]